jgi:hypothetical protein
MKSCKCGNTIPQRRLDMGYTVCVDCSTEVAWSAIQVVHHKTGNEIQIVKDPEVAAEFHAKSQRTGFGTLKGMTGSYKRIGAVKQNATRKPKEESAYVCAPSVIGRRPMPLDFEGVGRSVMDALENLGRDSALQIIDQALQEHRLLNRQATQLREIVALFTPENFRYGNGN